MTPLELEIAIHYATKAGGYREGDFLSKSVMEAIRWLETQGMIEEPCGTQGPGPKKYQATDKLKFFVDHLCTIPLPVCSWAIPKSEPAK
jgi:hypothetical protein